MPQEIWRECLDLLKAEYPAQQFNTWIRPLQPELNADSLTLFAPNQFVMRHVVDHFIQRIEEVIRSLHAGRAELKVILQVGSAKTASRPGEKPLEDPRKRANQITDQPQLADHDTTGKHLNDDEKSIAVIGGAALSESLGKNASGRSSSGDSGVKHQSFLDKSFTFASFVEGKSNQLARAASMQVAENPGGTQNNPLLLYGGVGLGKTHLMHAIGNEIVRRNPAAKVVYLRSERFVGDMVKALQLNAISEFKRYYRSVDALLIDDIQFFAGKERSQEEFFHTFNTLLESSRHVIVTSDRFPKEIDKMDERLKSRFGWGLTVMVDPPELETRVAILLKKAEQVGVKLSDEAAFFIAQKVRSNVRELEGALKLVTANAHFTGQDITPAFIRESLKDLLAMHEKLVSIDNIQRTVAEYYKIKVADLHSKRRTRSITRPRQMAMALAKELTNHSLPEIGDAFGRRDHTTVLHACRKILELRDTDPGIREDHQNFMRLLTN